jgi:hypothetical protein
MNDSTLSASRMQAACIDVAAKLIGFARQPAPA